CLIEYAERQFHRSRVVGGASIASHHAVVAKRRGTTKLNEPSLPAELRYLWSIFLDLHRTRSFGWSSANPISFAEIDAWCRLQNFALSGFELDVIRELDERFLSITSTTSETIAPKESQ
ncbi:MAG: hypothetical protein AB7O57_08115, partial [Hyphomicrobiaceae bacterium]